MTASAPPDHIRSPGCGSNRLRQSAWPTGTIPDATAAADPPLEPPVEWLTSQGLWRGPIGDRFGRGQNAELRCVGEAHHDESGSAKAPCQLLIFGAMTAESFITASPACTGSPAMEQIRSLSTSGTPRNGPSGIDAGGVASCVFEARPDDGIERGVELLDPADGVIDELSRRRRPVAYELRLRGGVQKGARAWTKATKTPAPSLPDVRPQSRRYCPRARFVQPTNVLMSLISLSSISRFHAESATSTTRNRSERNSVSTPATPRCSSHFADADTNR